MITAVILTKNEESKIKRCLSSLKEGIKEIIVVDDGSTDKTCEIAKAFGAKILVRNLNNNYGEQRNAGAAISENDWILALDADEVIPSESLKTVLAAVENVNLDVSVLEVFRLNHLLNKPLYNVGASTFDKNKLYRKTNAKFVGTIHEKIITQGRIQRINGEIWHYPNEKVAFNFNKVQKYIDVQTDEYLVERPGVTEKEIGYRLSGKMFKLFFKLYFKKQAYKDGLPGLIWVVLSLIGVAMFWITLWEKIQKRQEQKA